MLTRVAASLTTVTTSSENQARRGDNRRQNSLPIFSDVTESSTENDASSFFYRPDSDQNRVVLSEEPDNASATTRASQSTSEVF